MQISHTPPAAPQVPEDSAHVSGDPGSVVLAVRNDANAALSGTDGDYTPLSVDSSGRLKTDASITEVATAADGAAGLPALTKVVAGYDGANVQALRTDAAGDLQVDLASALPAGTNNIGDVDVLTEPATSADAAAGLPAVSKVIAGFDGANIRTVHTDAAGDLQVDLASAIPAGTNNIGDIDVLTEPATAAEAAAALPAVSKVIAGFDGSNVRTLKTDAAGELQIDVVGALPAGTNNIGDVDIASALPAGTNNIGDVDVLTEPATAADGAAGLPAVTKVVAGFDGTNVQALHTDAAGDLQIDVLSSALPTGAATETTLAAASAKLPATLGQKTMANSLAVTLASDQGALSVTLSGGVTVVDKARHDYAVNVTSGAYQQLTAALAGAVKEVEIFDSSGETLVLAVGAAAAEVDQIYIMPGGNGRVPLIIASGARVSIKAVSGTASAGYINVNFYG